MQSKMHVKDISIELTDVTISGVTYKQPQLRVEFKKAHGFTTGDLLKVTRGNTVAGWSQFNGSIGLYAQVINSTEIFD